MGIGSRTAAAVFCATALLAWSASLAAQDRFSMRTQSVVGDVSGLRVVTLRDNQTSQCYTLFMTDAPGAAAAPEPVGDDPLEQSVQRIREAAAKRDRQLAQLTARKNADISGAVPRYDDEVERRRIEDEYQRVLQTEIPSSAWPSRVPGTRSDGWDETTANIQRRAMLDPEPSATMRAMMTQLARLEDLLSRMVQSQRVAASGPVPCPQ
jgi:hypothetical protein